MHLTKNINLYPKPAAGVAMQEIAVSTSAVSLTAFTGATTYYVEVQAKLNSVYYTTDGSTPSATNGHILASGERVVWSRQRANAAKFLQNSGAARIVASPLTD
jgi:hypothetical protein